MFGLGSMEKRISGKIEDLEKKIEESLSNRIDGRLGSLIKGFEEKFELYLLGCLDTVDDRLGVLAERLDIVDGRFETLNERLQQSFRQERRNQAALDSLFENQQAEISILRSMRNESKALKALIAFAESFVLWRQSQPDSPEFQVLWAKLAALLDLFGIEVMAGDRVPFDPSVHEACAVRFDPDVPEGYVLETVRPGFVSGGEILRCASVVVNRFPIVADDRTENGTEDVADEDGEFVEEVTGTDDRIGV
ncbi:MAG: nucleotide exchange factor GrpE [Synergistaceae bacterium]|nr:nucleotide exchange factor GrpE [Synergistaceae bacterium]